MQVFRTLIEKTKDIKGSSVENNKFCVSVHYRNVAVEVILNSNTNHFLNFINESTSKEILHNFLFGI